MLLHLQDTGPAQPLNRFSLQQFVDEVSCFHRPAFGDLFFLDQHLSFLYFLFYLLSRFTEVRPFSHHNFVYNHSECVVVHLVSMTVVEHNFRGHVAWGARGVLSIVDPQMFGYSQIGKVGVS